MDLMTLAVLLIVLSIGGYYLGRGRALRTANGQIHTLHSLPSYYGYYLLLWCALPGLLILGAWLALEPHLVQVLVIQSLPVEKQTLNKAELGLLLNEIRNLASGDIIGRTPDAAVREATAYYQQLHGESRWGLTVLSVSLATAGLAYGYRRIQPRLRTRQAVEHTVMVLLVISSTIAIFTTIGIVLSLLFESIRFFQLVSPIEFLFGLQWSPQMALRADQVGSSGAFGAVPIFAGTLLITLIAMLVAGPIGLMSAIYMAEYASPRLRSTVKPLLEILAGIPTVVYGFFAALTVAPFIRNTGESIGLSVASESALAAGLVMGIMIIPFVSSLSDDVINAVPQSLRDGSYAMGATKSETVRHVILPAALPGVVGAFLLAISRAIGETMIVVMAAGLAANLTANPLEAVTTVTVQIVTLLVGDQEFDSPKTLAAFALGLMLFIVTLILNVLALRVVQKYREKYD